MKTPGTAIGPVVDERQLQQDLDYLEIGRSEGARIRFKLTEPVGALEEVEVFSTRPDTLFGMSFLALAPEHPLSAALAARDPRAA